MLLLFWDQGLPEVVKELMTPDAKQHFIPCVETQGWEQIMEYLGLAGLLADSFETIVHDVTVEGDTAYSHQTHIVTFMSEPPPPPAPSFFPMRMGGAPLKGQTIEWQSMARWKFNDEGLITEEWIVRDELSMVLQAQGTCPHPPDLECLCK